MSETDMRKPEKHLLPTCHYCVYFSLSHTPSFFLLMLSDFSLALSFFQLQLAILPGSAGVNAEDRELCPRAGFCLSSPKVGCFGWQWDPFLAVMSPRTAPPAEAGDEGFGRIGQKEGPFPRAFWRCGVSPTSMFAPAALGC